MEILIKKTFKEKLEKGFNDPVYFHQEILQRDLHKGQKTCLRNMKLKDSFILCGNRYGKGDIGAAYLAWLAFYKPVPKKYKDINISILNTSISQDQANIIYNKFDENFTNINTFSWIIKDIKKSPFPHIIFKNKITWWFRNASQNGKYLEGRSYFHINFDEADLQDNYYEFVTEILGPRVWDHGGTISHMTTPRRGKRNSYKLFNNMKKEYDLGNKNVYIHKGDSRENIFLHKKAIEKMNNLPERLFRKNVLGEYSDSDGTITSETLDQAEKNSIGLLETPRKDHTYFNGWDLARSSTFCTAATIEKNLKDTERPLQLVSWERFQDANRDRNYWQKVERSIKRRNEIWRGQTVIDKTGIGDVVFNYIEDMSPPPIGIQLGQQRGKLREDIINEGLSTIENGKIGIPPSIEQIYNNELWTLRDELSDFDQNHTDVIIWDFVCALFLAIYIANGHQIQTKEKKRTIPNIVAVKGSSKYGYR